MRSVGEVVVTLLTGVAATGAQAREQPAQTPPPASPATPAPDRNDAVASPAPQDTEFLDSEGRPLPPDIQQQLRERLRSEPPAPARPSPPQRAGDGELTVTGQRPRGSVIGDIPPQAIFRAMDIRAFGAANLTELLENVQSQVSSIRGRADAAPITLLNGRRISDFAEVARIPTEAIERLEVFPEELALRYGYRADQKIVNIVTFERFQSTNGQASTILPTEGARTAGAISADYFAIRDQVRFSLGGDYSRSALLLESDRDVLQPSATPDSARFRSLLPSNERLTLNGLVSGPLFGAVSSTLHGRFEASASESFLGPGNDRPLRRLQDTRSFQIGASLNGRKGRWIWSLTAGYDHATADILTDIANAPSARDEARSTSTFAQADLVLSGPLLNLPAGPVSATLSGGLSMRDFSSETSLGGIGQNTELSRDRGTLQASLDVPITGRRAGTSPLGALSVNANAELEQLSDFGTLYRFGYGLNWSPVEAVNVIAAATSEEGAPTLEQLGGPLVVTPGVRTFDFARREVVDVTRVFGGNPSLRFERRQTAQLGVSARPFPGIDLAVSADYVSTRIDDPIVDFPVVTPALEAALPERFTRDTDGRLLRVDSRPLNFQRSEQERLRWGINFTRPFGQARAPTGRTFSSEAEMRRMLPPGTRVIMAPAGTPMARRLENMTSRLFFSLYHSWQLKDEILAREGAPELDLLDGAAIDFRGGRRRHEIEFQAGAFKSGLGVRLTANWRSPARIEGLGGPGDALRLSGFGTVNINLFANLGDAFGAALPSWLDTTRLTIGVTNLFNARQQVQDESGLTPLNYQPAYLDPVGRSLNFSFRQVF